MMPNGRAPGFRSRGVARAGARAGGRADARDGGRAAALLAVLVAFVACSGPAGAGATPVPTRDPSAPTAPTSTEPSAGSSPGAGASPTVGPPDATPGVVLTQAWATAELTDVRNGQTFRIADLVADGRVVFIEPMAIWCKNCRSQQRDAVKALALLDPARVTWIGIDVESSESAQDLAAYSASNGFDWPFAVASTVVARALANDFGNQVLSPPSTPILVVGPDGTVTLTEFGHKSVDRILELAAAHGA
ncbi:MAG: hypothetical protein HW391_292 [Chloroflexi bacterium]|nr:hypothetical protein [Chloroflexota bacterium]